MKKTLLAFIFLASTAYLGWAQNTGRGYGGFLKEIKASDGSESYEYSYGFKHFESIEMYFKSLDLRVTDSLRYDEHEMLKRIDCYETMPDGEKKMINYILYSYDENKNLTKREYYMPDGEEWVASSRYEMTYNEQNQLVKRVLYSALSMPEPAVDQIIEYKYNDDGLLIEDVEQVADVFSGILSLYAKREYTYDAEKQLTKRLIYEYNEDEDEGDEGGSDKEGTWSVMGWHTYSYENGNCMQKESYLYDVLDEKRVYSYNYYNVETGIELEIPYYPDHWFFPITPETTFPEMIGMKHLRSKEELWKRNDANELEHVFETKSTNTISSPA